MISVFSENPENDLWRELLQFSYEANINRYLSKKGLHATAETINCIVGSFLQADEYYRSAKISIKLNCQNSLSRLLCCRMIVL